MSVLMKRLTFKKLSARGLQATKIVNNIEALRKRVIHGYRAAKGWKCHINDIIHDELDEPVLVKVEETDPETKEKKEVEKECTHSYEVDLDIGCFPKRGRKEESLEKEWEQVLKVITVTAKTKGWELTDNSTLEDDFDFPGVERKDKKEVAAE